MKKQITKLFFLLAIFFALPNFAYAADVYMSTTGTKTSGTSTVGDWSDVNCYGNLHAAMQAMLAGDTLTIDDGMYTGYINAIDSQNKPPSGIDKESMTIIKARNIPGQGGIPTGDALRVSFENYFDGYMHGIFSDASGDIGTVTQYVKFEGLFYAGGVVTAGFWNHIYFKQCAFMGTENGNSTALTIGGAYNLVEDSIFYGTGRYKFLTYDYARTGNQKYNVCRRCVARQDYANGNDEADMPLAVYTSYGTSSTAFLNSIAIDGDSPTYWATAPSERNGAFYTTLTPTGDTRIIGSMVINTAMVAFGFPNRDVPLRNGVRDSVGVKVVQGIGGSSTDASRLTFHTIGNNNFTWKSQAQATGATSFYNSGISGWSEDDLMVNNSIVKNAQEYGVHNVWGQPQVDHVNIFGTTLGVFEGISPSNLSTTDPANNGLLYPVRIETGSQLATAGSDGGQIGANILKRIGHDGDFWGDSGWDQEQSENLWPWPLEDWVKSQMASMPQSINGIEMPTPTRGFASPIAKQLDGASDVTLTSYIWESLGNQIPCEVYGTCSGDSIAPSAPNGLGVI